MTVWRHFGEIHGQEAQRRGQARQKHRMQVDPEGFNDCRAFRVSGAQALQQRGQQMHAIGHDDHQHDGRRRGRGRRERQPDPAAQPHGRENGEEDDEPGRRDPREPPGQAIEDQRHDRQAHGQKNFLAGDRRLREGVVDHHGPHHTEVDARKLLFRLGGKAARECGDLGDLECFVFLRQFHGDVDGADAAIPGQEAARKTRVGESRCADQGPFLRIVQLRRIHEVAHEQVVAICRRVLEVRD